jgi:hypothetical protein
MTTGFDYYTIWNAISSHFNKSSYDYFKYNGNIKVSKNAYESRKDRYFFEKASKKYNTEDFKMFLVSNLSDPYIENNWIGQLLTAKHEIIYKKWKKRVESLSYNFKEEVQSLHDKESNFDSLFTFVEGKHPLLFRLYSRQKVSLETLVILNELVKYTSLWKKNNDIVINDIIYMIERYSPFFWQFTRADVQKMRNIVLKEYA